MIDLASAHFPVGVAIGVAAAAPVGPINLLVIQRALGGERGAALLLGLGGALGDAVFAGVAAFGLAAVMRMLDVHEGLIRIIGGIVMLVFAVVIWRAAPRLGVIRSRSSAPRMAAAVFGMTLTNPATLFFFLGSFGAVRFAGIGHDTPLHLFNAGLVVAGVFLGSMLWWVIVSWGAMALRGRITDGHLVVLNHATAIVLALFGVVAVYLGVTA
ncbi:LysE family translocator [Glacieibacterium frigidum]|uniref:Lysine transporter LysE n=1 Tax=Glacieibacterium frigidum TaxID=2593303 RepID=A0A552U8L5_9SPHN|nr:LysE family transporter [Glacieibacterium frigidum]TRW14551.1 hypothetical protein FMM06_12690 [Glacieibacterium frigidum]